MSNQNNDNNPPQPSPQNIQGVQNPQGPIGTANTAGNVTGGVGNTNINVVQAQGDKECVEKELLHLRCVLSVKEEEKQDRIESVRSLEFKINKLEEEVENLRKQTYDKREDIQNIERKIRKLMSDVERKKDEIAGLERNIIPGLKKQIEETQIRLKILKETVDDTTNAIPGLETQVQELKQNLTKYDTDVKAERESIAELYILVQKLGNDLSDRKNDQKKMAEKMQNIEAEQAKQTRQFEDDRREREELQGQIQNLHKVIEEKDKVIEEQDKVIEKKDKVIEEQDKDIRQLKDARAAVEGKVQEPQDAVQEKTTQNKHGREEGKKVAGDLKTGPAYQQAGDEADQHGGKTGDCLNIVSAPVAGDLKTGPTYQQAGDEADQHGASSDVEEIGTTATVREADDSVPHQGVTQKDSNPRHVDDLFAACYHGNMAEVKRVLDLGQVDINGRGRVWGWTPVMEAALEGHRDVVELLLSRGADVSLVDVVGNNILHYACMGGDVGTVELILSRGGVDVNARNNDGETAADVARGRGHHQLVDLLVSRAAR